MRALDYAEHNAEVRALWERYQRGKPPRVPMILGINPRYTAFDHPANPRRIAFEQYFADPQVMLTRQLEHQSWVRRHVPQDAEMGLPEKGWEVYVDFLNSYEAGWLGCSLRYFGGEVPDTWPLLQDEARKYLLFERGIPDPFKGGLMQRNWDFYEYFRRQQEQGFTWEGRPIAQVRPAGLGTDGPLTVACNLRGASELYLDLAQNPEYACRLLDFITEATIARIRAYRQHLGLPLKPRGLAFADDAVQSISISMYRELILPCHWRLIQALSSGGPHAIHLCGDASRFFGLLRQELDIRSFDTGFPIDLGQVRQELGPEVEIKGGPSVMFLQTASPDQVRQEVKRILESGAAEGRFILREGNNLPPGVSLENLWAMYEAVRQFSRYGA
jgi:hypothetical protein